MGNKENGQAQDLVRLRQRLDEYRRDSQPGKALPGWAWAAAGRLARRHGVHRSSRALGLEYNKLKRLSGAGAADRSGQGRKSRSRRSPCSMQFVDLSGALTVGGDCRMVLEGPGGQRLSVQMPAGAATEVVLGLCRAGFGARS
ncbi:MAG: hypothetical protein ACREV7_21895 [Steroidobacteraceae bacterium]